LLAGNTEYEEASMSAPDPSRLLRQVLKINAAISGLTGLVMAVFARPVDRLIGADAVTAVGVVGVGLALFAVGVFAVGRAHEPTLHAGGRVILLLDVIWVIASVAVVLAGWFNTTGAVLVLLVAAVVGAFAVGEAIGLRRLAQPVSKQPAASYRG
jgi:hypothetical protein